ncbi:hypothetical protein [Geothrix campi]|uniref:hypothetical protein n=1 Tax=Geothrix campi TaxID=2966450 RepID=UPI002148D807|nr:hypothetical protein [Geothrix sp. SG10]
MNFLHCLSIVMLILTSQVVSASDWKYGGMTKSGNDTDIVFYDNSSIIRTSTVTRFWIKSISLKKLNAYSAQKSRRSQLIDASATKIAQGYIPAFLGLKSVRAASKSDIEFKDRVATVILWEVIANNHDIKMSSRFCFEINCDQKMIRAVEGDLFDNQGNVKPKQGPMNQEWGFIAPDTTSAWWSELVCLPK